MMKYFAGIMEERCLRRPRTARPLSLQLVLVVFACVHSVSANSETLFKAGSEAYAQAQFEEAINAYTAAAADAPESAKIYFHLGNALYRAGGFEAALAAYENAASTAATASLQSRCWYNMANCMVKTAEGLRESEPQAAVQYCQQAAWFYRTALKYDAAFSDAAYNLEISQHIAAAIAEDIQKKEEDDQKQNELIKYIREKLAEFIERQSRLMETNNTGELQKVLETETRELEKMMEESGLTADIPLPDGTAEPGPLKKTRGHTAQAADAMAVPDPSVALAELMAALAAAPEDPDRQGGESDEGSDNYEDSDMEYENTDQAADMYAEADPFGDFSEYEEIRGVPPPNQSETDILAEEVRNQEQRKQKRTGKYNPVEKDW